MCISNKILLFTAHGHQLPQLSDYVHIDSHERERTNITWYRVQVLYL